MVASGESTSPLDRHGPVEDGTSSIQNYPIESAIVGWIQSEHSRRIFGTALDSSAGWEGWLQLELEMAFRDIFDIDLDTQVREQSQIFNQLENPKKVDRETLLLPQTDNFKGMIIKLRCENGATNGSAIQGLVQEDLDMVSKVKAQYKDYTFVVLAMACTLEAHEALTNIGLDPIPQTEYIVDDLGTMKVYKYAKRQ
ncbi:hypothetical protein DM02DRAFT_616519 [Periconia macrospinosa]|uniref:Uncharacterized protein n=1 Tax=Periconia macrospinosa TaxID=97972 RepID=A0A2V1DH43_9PLEO|nr:hypothetical protein DM02DRAFT_616519 [Periconia macrospinosa]